jgi:hypothetical protein
VDRLPLTTDPPLLLQEIHMFAIIAAFCFGFALLLDLINQSIGELFTPGTLTLAGLLFVALHLAGAGTAVRSRSAGWRRNRR